MSLIQPRARMPTDLPDWAQWAGSLPYAVGIEEEVMVLDPAGWALAPRTDELLGEVKGELADALCGETHQAVLELTSTPHAQAAAAGAQLAELRRTLEGELAARGLRAAAAGTHPLAMWTDVHVSAAPRYRDVHDSMRELARREPTFAQHVHIGVADPEEAVLALNRLRTHLPLLLALSANSPFWQGRDSGLASARTPIFQAFPRVGIPRAFHDYADYAEAIDRLVRCGAFEDPTFLWWDVRLQPRFGTVEVRVMDAQTTSTRTGALAALVQTLVHLELEGEHDTAEHPPEILDENRFLAARDGLDAELLDPVAEERVPARELLEELLDAAEPHARALGAAPALAEVRAIAQDTGQRRQRRVAHRSGLRELMAHLSREFTAG